MPKTAFIQQLIVKHKYRLLVTYSLFTIESLGGLLRFYFFGEAVNQLIKGSYTGVFILVAVHLTYLVVGTIRHMYDTRTYTAIYTEMVTRLLSKGFNRFATSKLSAHSTLAREFVDFLEHDLVYVLEAVYNLAGSLIILAFYDHAIALICLFVLVPVVLISKSYGRKMKRLTQRKNDELEKQVDIIGSGDKKLIQQHYASLRKWQIRISNKEAINFGIMEMLVLIVITAALFLSHTTIETGSLFGIYNYILKFASGLDTIPYTIERVSSLSDISRRLENEEHSLPKERLQEALSQEIYSISSQSKKYKATA